MKRCLLLTLLMISVLTSVSGQGLPFFHNISASTYGGHKQNFDIELDDNGIIFVANFEGLLYYDYSAWHIIHTQSITRVTLLLRDSKGKLWVGGYNFFGYVKANEQGILELKEQDTEHILRGEVTDIWEDKGEIYFAVSNGKTYTAKQNRIFQTQNNIPIPYNYTPIGISNVEVMWREKLDNGWTAVATNGNGLYITDAQGNIIYQLNEDNGLCSDNVVSLVYDHAGQLWGATDNGLFVAEIPSPYTRFTQSDGLKGEVISLAKMGGRIYAGTMTGVYQREGNHFEHVNTMNYACWGLVQQGDNLLAATSNGVYRIMPNNTTQQLSTNATTAILVDDNYFYSGEQDGVYYYATGKAPVKVCEAERATKFLRDQKGVIWIQNLYGKIWNNAKGNFEIQQTKDNGDELAALVMYNHQPTIVTANSKTINYPLFSYEDKEGVAWMTDNKGRNLYALVNGDKKNKWNQLIFPLTQTPVRALLHDGMKVWIGGARGLTVADGSKKDPGKTMKPKMFMRSIVVNDDSVAWGGFTELPKHMVFKSDERHLVFYYGTNRSSLLLATQYRYRLNGGRWSSWDTDAYTEYENQIYGDYVFEVQARDAYGQLSDILKLSFEIEVPLYWRWYMLLGYLAVLALIGYGLTQWRLRKLEKDKMRLEAIVQERTAEVVKQKDEIEEKSKSLETALSELSEAQSELVRQEKMATVGKLTQGLIDRILNPLNYINNFAKLSEGLVDDARANIEDEKDRMSPENYDDTIDVLTMLKGNLQKVGEHGSNTTRTLKAMEEVMKDRSSGIIKTDLVSMMHKDEEMLNTYYEKDITKYHIKCVFECPTTPIYIMANPELLSSSLMSLLNNSLYAVKKKAKRKEFTPEIDVTLTKKNNLAQIVIRDNGIGIEDTIIHKIFDPFFTTKTTGEASGVGLYLSREVIQNYGGDIRVASLKDEYTEFTIIIPTT